MRRTKWFARNSVVATEDPADFWPLWLGEDVPEIAIRLLGFPAADNAWRGYAMALPNRARQLLELIRLNSLGDRPIIFIVHSLGGLLVKCMLRTALTGTNCEHKRIGCATRGILFLATPHAGSLLASIHNIFRVVSRPNWPIRDLELHSPYLEDLSTWFADNFSRLNIQTHVLREGRPTRGVMVVDRDSGNPGIGQVPVIDTDCDHITICKPTSRDSLVYRTAVDFVRVCLVHSKRIRVRETKMSKSNVINDFRNLDMASQLQQLRAMAEALNPLTKLQHIYPAVGMPKVHRPNNTLTPSEQIAKLIEWAEGCDVETRERLYSCLVEELENP